MDTKVYSTDDHNDDEVMTDIEFNAWRKRFLNKKNTALQVARIILNNKQQWE